MQPQEIRESSSVEIAGEIMHIAENRSLTTGKPYALLSVSLPKRQGDRMQPFAEVMLAAGPAYDEWHARLFVGDMIRVQGTLRGYCYQDGRGADRCRLSIVPDRGGIEIIDQIGRRAAVEAETERR